MNRLVGVVVLLGAMGGAPRDARACSPPACVRATFTPGLDVSVPANIAGLHWVPGYSLGNTMSDPSIFTLATTTNPSTPLTFTTTSLPSGGFLMVPDQALVAGTTYTVSDSSECGGVTTPVIVARFTVTASAPLPTQLGTLTGESVDPSTLTVQTASGSCTADVWADTATFDLAVTGDAMPWLHAFLVETIVDGVVWRHKRGVHGSFMGDNFDRIYHVCVTDDPYADLGLDAGSRSVLLRASLPGTTTEVETAAVTVGLACDADPPPDVCTDNPALCDEDNDVDPMGDEDPAGCCSSSSPDGPWVLVVFVAAVWRRRRVTRVR